MSAAAPLPPVLLLHGFGGTAERTWRDNGWIDLLGDADRSVLAPDLLGHGTSPRPHEPGAYRAVEDLVAAGLPTGGPVDAIGFSMGARVILALAAATPARFRRIVVAGVGANLFRDDDHAFLSDALRHAQEGALSDNPIARYFQQLATSTDTDPLALAAFLDRPGSPPLGAEQLGRIAVPTLVVLGDRDFAGPADPLVDALPDADLVVLRGTDHFSTPKSFAFIDAALEFVGQP